MEFFGHVLLIFKFPYDLHLKTDLETEEYHNLILWPNLSVIIYIALWNIVHRLLKRAFFRRTLLNYFVLACLEVQGLCLFRNLDRKPNQQNFLQNCFTFIGKLSQETCFFVWNICVIELKRGLFFWGHKLFCFGEL